MLSDGGGILTAGLVPGGRWVRFSAMVSVLRLLLLTLRTCLFARGASSRNPGLAASAWRAAAHPTAPSPAREDGPVALGHACACLGRVANGAGPRQAGDRHRLAPAGLPALVDLEESTPPRPTDGARRHPEPDSHDGGGEPALGRAADPWRTAETRDRGVSVDRGEIHEAPAPAALTDVAHVPVKRSTRMCTRLGAGNLDDISSQPSSCIGRTPSNPTFSSNAAKRGSLRSGS